MPAAEPDHLDRHGITVRVEVVGEHLDVRVRLVERDQVVDRALDDQGRDGDVIDQSAGTAAGQHISLTLGEDAQQVAENDAAVDLRIDPRAGLHQPEHQQ